MSAACRSCGAPVIWAFTKKGKRMALDAEPALDGRYELVPDRDDEGRSIQVAVYCHQGGLFAEGMYKPHWATCPDTQEWRRPAKP